MHQVDDDVVRVHIKIIVIIKRKADQINLEIKRNINPAATNRIYKNLFYFYFYFFEGKQ
jgi:hypothetical protein